MRLASLPSRERGLKFLVGVQVSGEHRVAPFTGAWIEICLESLSRYNPSVAPFTGAWIEI